jgi:hypothetical protein
MELVYFSVHVSRFKWCAMKMSFGGVGITFRGDFRMLV